MKTTVKLVSAKFGIVRDADGEVVGAVRRTPQGWIALVPCDLRYPRAGFQPANDCICTATPELAAARLDRPGAYSEVGR